MQKEWLIVAVHFLQQQINTGYNTAALLGQSPLPCDRDSLGVLSKETLQVRSITLKATRGNKRESKQELC